ncbi:MAG: response regulator [Candidatus Hydrogenedentes bacterium]|nr:response regulator [Candidatus Hydrogenedentota bacterium]
MSRGRPPVLLLVEDDPGDQELTRRALEAGALKTHLYVVNDGEEALDFLHHRGKYAVVEAAPRPDLILLDLNLPRLDGRQVLEAILRDPDLYRISVVVLTTSEHENDIRAAYDLGVNSYIIKPSDMQKFIHAVRCLQEYWFGVVTLAPAT